MYSNQSYFHQQFISTKKDMLSSNSSFKTLTAYIKNAMHTVMHYIEPKQLLSRDPSKCPQIDHLLFALSQKKSKARVPTSVRLFRDDATTAKGPGCDEETNRR